MYMFERQINCLVQKLYICIQVDNVLAHFEREGFQQIHLIFMEGDFVTTKLHNIIFIHVYCKDNMLFRKFFSLRNTYTCITNNYSIYMVIISMLYYLIKTIFINNWNICIKVKNEVNPWLLTCTVLREYIINVHYCIL